MLVSAEIKEKIIGSKKLFSNLNLSIVEGEKIGVIGRNGAGKTSLFKILAGQDNDFDGEVKIRKNSVIVLTAQEHPDAADQTSLDYILASLPQYSKLHKIIETYPSHMGDNLRKIHKYSEAIETFTQKDYYRAEDKIIEALRSYQIDEASARGPMSGLSGGQKRFVELVKVQQSGADIALIDEPTNHMDYVAKDAFIDWMSQTSATLAIITHDRDVLKYVDRIIEIKDMAASSYKGNYSAYLKINSSRTVAGMAQYEVAQRTIENLKKQIEYARSKKASWGGTADKKNPFVVMEERALKQLRELEKTEKPSFWIDKDSVDDLNYKMVDKYQKYKDKNIRLGGLDSEHRRQELLKVDSLSLGYNSPVFTDISFALYPGERIRLHGRNGAGKTTLAKYIIAVQIEHKSEVNNFNGQVELHSKTRIGYYQQEIGSKYLKMPLAQAIEEVHHELGLQITDQKVRQLLSSYLFDATRDYSQTVETLSGGQKARFQIISMLAGDPNLLILDEPTNHLDLPSIEELESALQTYSGALIYISHDSYFVDKLGGTKITIGS